MFSFFGSIVKVLDVIHQDFVEHNKLLAEQNALIKRIADSVAGPDPNDIKGIGATHTEPTPKP